MANPIIKGQTFATADQVSASKLNNLVDLATFDSDCVDGVTMQVTGDVLAVKDGGISTSKLGVDITAAGKALLDDASASAQRTTLGLGTIATQDSSSVSITGGSVTGITDLAVADGGTGASTANAARVALNRGTTALTDAATIATDASTGNVFTVTLGGNRTLGNPTNLQAGATYIWIVTQDGSGGRTLGYGSAFKWANAGAPTVASAIAAKSIISGVSDGTNIYCTAILDVR